MMGLVVEPMRPADVPEVEAIDARTRGRPWPPGTFLHEVEVNPHAAYFVARAEPAPRGDGRWVARLRRRAARHRPGVVGFGGMWMQHDEAHIAVLAVDPRFQRRHVGERLLVRLIQHAHERHAQVVTLEVRASNLPAQRLYAKYGFTVVGARRRYYSDNNEDALIMTTPPLADPAWRAHVAWRAGALGVAACPPGT